MTSTPACAVQIVEPVYEVDTTVTVTGDPGDTVILRDMDAGGAIIGSGVLGGSGYCNGSVVINVGGSLVDGHIIAAISTLYPSSDTACVGVTTCWPTATSTPTTTATPLRPDLQITSIDVSPSSPITAYVPVTFTKRVNSLLLPQH